MQKAPEAVDNITSDIRLGPPSSKEPLIDLSAGPLFHFHLRERLYQPKPKSTSLLDQASLMSVAFCTGYVPMILLTIAKKCSRKHLPPSKKQLERGPIPVC